MIDNKYFYFHIVKDSPCECCGSDISLSWYSTRHTDRYYSGNNALTFMGRILDYSLLFQLKWNHKEIK